MTDSTSNRVHSLVRSEAGRRRRLRAAVDLEVAVRRISSDIELTEHVRSALSVVDGDGAEVYELPRGGER
jgi:hypothetical protein